MVQVRVPHFSDEAEAQRSAKGHGHITRKEV